MPPGGQEQHYRDSRGRRTLEELLIGMDRRNWEKFEFLRAWEDFAFQQEETLMNRFMEQKARQKELGAFPKGEAH